MVSNVKDTALGNVMSSGPVSDISKEPVPSSIRRMQEAVSSQTYQPTQQNTQEHFNLHWYQHENLKSQ